MSQATLFDPTPGPGEEQLAPGAWLLRGFALAHEAALLEAILTVSASAPFRHLTTPGGHVMSVAMTNAGPLGWISERRGYRYSATDPDSGRLWPAIPTIVLDIARAAVARAGFSWEGADACLVNRYVPGARLHLHQDRNEVRLTAPIVSISLGLPATFLWGGLTRTDRARRLPVRSGDVAVWGGPSRMVFHGIAPLAAGEHPLTGGLRYNITLRRAAETAPAPPR